MSETVKEYIARRLEAAFRERVSCQPCDAPTLLVDTQHPDDRSQDWCGICGWVRGPSNAEANRAAIRQEQAKARWGLEPYVGYSPPIA